MPWWSLARAWLEGRASRAGVLELDALAVAPRALPTPCRTHPTQVSWSLDHKSAHAGTYEVRFFDEESYSLLRKVSVPGGHPGLQ